MIKNFKFTKGTWLFIFWVYKFALTRCNFGINFRLSNHNVPLGSSTNPYARGRRLSFWVGNVYWTFKIRIFHRPFWDLENVLSPEGTSACRLQRGPFVFTYVLFCVRKRILDFFFSVAVIRLFEVLKIFVFVSLANRSFRWSLENVLSPKGLCKAELNGVHLTVFPFYCVRKGCLDLSFQWR